MIKTFNKPGVNRNTLNLIKDSYEKPTANTRLNGKRNASLLRLRTRQGVTYLFTIALRVLAKATRQEK